MKKDYLKKYCTGCGLCKSYANMEFETDDRGFITPILDSEDKVLFCESVCPSAGISANDQGADIWGKRKSVYLGYAQDDEIRYHASSGGMITSICLYLLNEKIVDGILHIGVSDESVYSTALYCSTTKSELIQRSGSRYCISSPLAEISKLVEKDKKYAFVGKPCDVSALKNCMQMQEDLKKQVIFTLSFFCAGMPSDLANKRMIEELLGTKALCSKLSYRGDGWPGYAMALDDHGNCKKMEYEKSWGKILGRDVNYSCKFCVDGIGEMADIACGDAWYLTKQKKPDFAEQKGRNVVFARTDSGSEVLDHAQKQGYIYLEDFEKNIAELAYMQPYQQRRKATMLWKGAALRLFFRTVPRFNYRLLYKWQKNASIKDKLKVFLGTAKRIILNKI